MKVGGEHDFNLKKNEPIVPKKNWKSHIKDFLAKLLILNRYIESQHTTFLWLFTALVIKLDKDKRVSKARNIQLLVMVIKNKFCLKKHNPLLKGLSLKRLKFGKLMFLKLFKERRYRLIHAFSLWINSSPTFERPVLQGRLHS